MKKKQSLSEIIHCYWCDKEVEKEKALIRGGKYFCCEGCYLGDFSEQAHLQELDEAYMALTESLVTALDTREHETGLHSKRVACHTQVLARQSISDSDTLKQIYWGSLLHDIGKIAIPDSILLKQGKLTDDEWKIMRTHPQKGHDIIVEVPFLDEAAKIILYHEERYDGKGYPEGLAGKEIPWGARLFAVIDTLDAITNDRPYRKGLSFDVAKKEITNLSGKQFDPNAVDAFLAEENTLREMVEMKCFLTPDFSR